MTSFIRVLDRSVALAVVAACLSAAPARPDIVVLTDGATIKVTAYRLKGDEVVLELPGGGRMTLSIERVDRAIADEVLEAEAAEAARLAAPPPADFSIRYVEGHDQPATPYGGSIWEAARNHGLNPRLLAAVAEAESRFDARAVSHKGARGLLQLMPATGRRLGLRPAELFDPIKNLDAGARYLRQLADRFQDDLSLMLAAYNAGEGAVERWGGVPPYRETWGYLARIYARLGIPSPAGGK
jgi:soluble lytic murein transglycosylase-like protein